MAEPKATIPLRLVLGVLADGKGGKYGGEIATATGLAGGTVHPILARLLKHGWVKGEWEEGHPAGRPPRRYWKLTALGERMAADLAKRGLRSMAERIGDRP